MLEGFFAPRSVAVVGASRDPSSVGRLVFENVLGGGFEGEVHPVNPRASRIAGRAAYASVLDLPGPVDLAVIVVPAAAVPDVVDECGRAGIRCVIVISAGFKETGSAGGALERRLVETLRRYDMRMIGPNCLGVISTPARLNASFAAQTASVGSMAFMSQSGALGTALLDWATASGIGLSAFVSLGNEADVTESDLARVWARDSRTRVVAAYLESVTDGAAFIEAVSELTAAKPMVVLKGGRSDAGARAVSSHTGSLAGSDAAYEAALHKAGAIRARSSEHLVDVAVGFSSQPLPRAGGVAMLTNAGGPAVLATDACDAQGVVLASLGRETVDRLREALPAAAAVYNPVDLLGDATAERYREAADLLYADGNVGSLLAILTPQATTDAVSTAEAIVRAARGSGTTTVACFMGEGSVTEARRVLRDGGVPSYAHPERAVDVLAAMRGHAERPRAATLHDVPSVPRDREAAAEMLARGRQDGVGFITDAAAAWVASAYGIPVPEGELASDLASARRTAARIGYPVAVKVASPDILHKTDIGGVRLGVADDSTLGAAYDDVIARARAYMADAAIWGVYVQRMVPPGREVIVGVERDVTFGPLLMFGLGGIHVEVLRDVSFRLCPVTHTEAREMIAEIRSYQLLRGARGRKPADVSTVADVIVRASLLASDLPEITELDLNPLIVADEGGGALAADVRIGIGGM